MIEYSNREGELERHATLILAARMAGARGRGLLAPRHHDVLDCMARGLSYSETAAELGISLETVKEHLKIARRRLGARNTNQAIALAIRQGLIE